MAVLDDLNDVNTAGKQDRDRLTWDEALGLWVPKPPGLAPWSFEATYPAGDNGHVYVNTFATPFDCSTHIENTVDPVPDDNWKIAEFEVTAAMLPTVTHDGAPFAAPLRQLEISVSLEVEFSTTRGVRLAIGVNGVRESYRNVSASAARRRVMLYDAATVEVGDTVTLHVWRSAGVTTETMDVVLSIGTPLVRRWGLGDLGGALAYLWTPNAADPTVVESTWRSDPPAGVDAFVVGPTNATVFVTRQNGINTATSTSWLGPWGLKDNESLGVAAIAAASAGGSTANNSPGDPYFSRTHQIEEARFWYALLPEPTP